MHRVEDVRVERTNKHPAVKHPVHRFEMSQETMLNTDIIEHEATRRLITLSALTPGVHRIRDVVQTVFVIQMNQPTRCSN